MIQSPLYQEIVELKAVEYDRLEDVFDRAMLFPGLALFREPLSSRFRNPPA